jgi:hypothetical protein
MRCRNPTPTCEYLASLLSNHAAAGGFLISQALCLSGYQNGNLAWWAWRVGLGLFMVPYVTPIFATILSVASQGVWRTTTATVHHIWAYRPGLQDALMIVAVGVGLVLAVHIYRLPAPSPITPAWRITPAQQGTLLAALDHVPKGEKYKIWLATVEGCRECRMHAEEIGNAWAMWGLSHGWDVGGFPNSQVSVFTGPLVIAERAKHCPAAELQLIESALKAAKIPFDPQSLDDSYGASVGVPRPGSCFALVGSPYN